MKFVLTLLQRKHAPFEVGTRTNRFNWLRRKIRPWKSEMLWKMQTFVLFEKFQLEKEITSLEIYLVYFRHFP